MSPCAGASYQDAGKLSTTAAQAKRQAPWALVMNGCGVRMVLLGGPMPLAPDSQPSQKAFKVSGQGEGAWKTKTLYAPARALCNTARLEALPHSYRSFT